MIGKTLSHYKITSKLGEGGMGEVYLARDTTLDRDVALKLLPEDLANDPERRKRFEREAKAVAALKHPNIVTIHTVEEADGLHFITMELVEGETLASVIGRGALDLDRFFDIAIPLTDAVSTAHAKGVAHRDLKPANIMFDADGRLKVLDFGLAKLFESDMDIDKTTGADSDTAEGKVLGTAAYMSPEQAEGGKIDHRSDVFSLGIIFYEMLTGEKPFKGKTSISTLSAVMRDTPAPISELKPALPRHLGRIIRRCMEKAPDRRFQGVLDLRNDLRDLKDETTADKSSASGIDVGRPEIRATRGSNNLMKVLVPAALVLVVLAALLILRQGDEVAEQGAQTMRLAVLPFENLGASEDDYFSDGITDEITAKLAILPGLAVISRASSKKYKNTDKDMQTIGSELNVDYILEGTIRWDKSGARQKVRITPQLINVADDSHVWASNYEREIDEIFVVQADIAKQIATALDVTLVGSPESAEASAPTTNVDAYQSYLRSLEYDEEDEAGIRVSIGLLERATELDPTFAVAWAELSKNHSGMCHYGFDRTPERLAAAKDAAERAMALDSDLPDAYIAMGYYHYWGHRDYDRALEAIDFAEKINPNDPRVLAVKSFVLRRQAKLEEALAYMQRSFEIDPQNAVTCRDIGFTNQLLRRYDEGISYHERAIGISPDFWNNYVLTGWAYAGVGDTATASRMLRSAPDQNLDKFEQETLELRYFLRQYDTLIDAGKDRPDNIVWLQTSVYPLGFWVAQAYKAKGNHDEAGRFFEGARVQLEELLQSSPDDDRLHSGLGQIYAALGRKEEAISHGKRATELVPPAKDFLKGMEILVGLAMIYVQVGESELAFDTIEYLLTNPSDFTVSYLRLHVAFDPLRDHPRYKEIIARYEAGVP